MNDSVSLVAMLRRKKIMFFVFVFWTYLFKTKNYDDDDDDEDDVFCFQVPIFFSLFVSVFLDFI